jgi:osmotically-inducible protein OsmY
MKRTHFLVTMTAGLLAVTGGVAYADAGASASDGQLVEAVKAKLAADVPEIAPRLQVEAKDGVVTLRGTAMTSALMLKAIKDAQSVNGVSKVQNRMGLE